MMMMTMMRKTALMRIVMIMIMKIMRMMTRMIAQRMLLHDIGGVGKVVVMKMIFISASHLVPTTIGILECHPSRP